jgi:hypothetical protein
MKAAMAIAAVFLIAASSCTTTHSSWPPAQHEVVEYARANAQKLYAQRQDRDEYVFGFNYGFHHGLVKRVAFPQSLDDMDNDNPVGRGANDAWRYQESMSPTSVLYGVSLVDYGYVSIQTNGTYRAGPEWSDFRPASDGGEVWYMRFHTGTPCIGVVSNSARVCVKGYLSPEFDFKDGCNRQLLVTELVVQ